MIKSFKKEFEEKITELGNSFNIHMNGFYILHIENDKNHLIYAQLIESISVVKKKYGSKNGNDVQSIGLFKFKISTAEPKPDFFILGFQNPVKKQSEYIIIPKEEFERRLYWSKSDSNHYKRIKIVFWLMTDGFIYNTTGVSIEGEWFFISKGKNGRMADETFMDYTKFLNGWHMLRPS